MFSEGSNMDFSEDFYCNFLRRNKLWQIESSQQM